MKSKVDVQQVFISAADIFGIGLLWINSNEKVFKRSAIEFLRRSLTWQDSACFPKEEALSDEVIDAMEPQ